MHEFVAKDMLVSWACCPRKVDPVKTSLALLCQQPSERQGKVPIVHNQSVSYCQLTAACKEAVSPAQAMGSAPGLKNYGGCGLIVAVTSGNSRGCWLSLSAAPDL